MQKFNTILLQEEVEKIAELYNSKTALQLLINDCANQFVLENLTNKFITINTEYENYGRTLTGKYFNKELMANADKQYKWSFDGAETFVIEIF